MKGFRLAWMVTSLLAAILALSGAALAQSSDALVVDVNGRVGIGTASPSSNVHILGDKPSVLKIDFNETSYNGEDILSSIEFGSPTGDNGAGSQLVSAYIRAVKTRAGTGLTFEDAGLTFGTLPNGSGSLAERMRIDHLGKVGIGTASPVRQLSLARTDATTDGMRITTAQPVLELVENDQTLPSGAFRLQVLGGVLQLLRNTNADSVFSTNSTDLTVDQNGNVGLGATQFGTSGAKVLGLHNGTAPTSSPVNMIQLYAMDYVDGDGTATSELFVRDEDGNAPDLSPHIFALYQPDTSEPFPWSYYAENNYLGKIINVDMAGAIRAIERLSGKQFIFYKDIPKADVQKEKREEWKKNWIAQNTTEQEVSKDAALEVVQVMVQDTSTVVSEKVSYALDGRNVVEVRTPVYATRAEQKWQLKNGARFDTNTGKFFMKKEPTEADAEAAASTQFQLVVRKWIRDRM
jgi:hypothetical protein